MRIYICSFWAGETRFHTHYVLVWDQLVLARELHEEFGGGIFGLSWVRQRELRPVRRWKTLSSAMLETLGLMITTRYPMLYRGYSPLFLATIS